MVRFLAFLVVFWPIMGLAFYPALGACPALLSCSAAISATAHVEYPLGISSSDGAAFTLPSAGIDVAAVRSPQAHSPIYIVRRPTDEGVMLVVEIDGAAVVRAKISDDNAAGPFVFQSNISQYISLLRISPTADSRPNYQGICLLTLITYDD